MLPFLRKRTEFTSCRGDRKTVWIRSVVVGLSVISSLFAFLLFYRLTGSEAMLVFLVVPAMIIGRFWGSKSGAIAGLGAALLAAFFMYRAEPNIGERAYVFTVAALFFVSMGGMIGRLSELASRAETSEQYYRSLFTQSYDGILITDEQGVIVEWNKREEDITGLKQAEAVGSFLWDVLYRSFPVEQRSPEIHKKVKSALRCLLKRAEAPFVHVVIEQPSHQGKGSVGIIQRSLFPIETEKGFVVGGISRNIRELKIREDALGEIVIKIQELDADEKVLSGFLPICIKCKKIRDRKGSWHEVEVYFQDHSTLNFSHTLCPECAKNMYPTFMKAKKE